MISQIIVQSNGFSKPATMPSIKKSLVKNPQVRDVVAKIIIFFENQKNKEQNKDQNTDPKISLAMFG